MDQRERNEQEWNDPKNWSGSFLGIYRSERDTRVIVPKKIRSMGWTFNFAKPAATWYLLGILLFAAIVIGISFALTR